MSIPDNMNYSLMALLIVTALLVGKSAQGFPNGGVSGGEEWAEDSIAHGCSCHMDEQLNEGMYNLNGIPDKYKPENTYNISLTIADKNVEMEEDALRYGGFLAEVNEGTFVANENYWVGGEGTYISHNDNSNDVRNWTFEWAAPADGSGDAFFVIYFNVVNGQGTNGDQWSYLTAVSLGTPQTSSHDVSIHELGVTLMQYWIGLIGLGVGLLAVLISYVVMRGGSSHYRG
ncbi:MAG TPA: choice-of-anchor V domain-containing protein [Candidatus Poseidoniia archaeon]|nr:choice-of-anchor V domain-containing protein [Candidatus Poseidoniia archaeon]